MTSTKMFVAQSILGKDFITTEEIRAVRPSVIYGSKQIDQLAGMIPPEEVLHLFKQNGYGLIPQPPRPYALPAIRELKPSHFYPKTGDRYNDSSLANDVTGIGWLAIKKKPIDNSMCKNLCKQKKQLSENEFVPNLPEVSWFAVVFLDVRNVRLFSECYIRTSSEYRVRFGPRGLSVNKDWSSSRGVNLRLTSAWKL